MSLLKTGNSSGFTQRLPLKDRHIDANPLSGGGWRQAALQLRCNDKGGSVCSHSSHDWVRRIGFRPRYTCRDATSV
ncbi:MAG: hypothetical protein KME69_18945 [Candidatus Thiodiazotropha sp. (ex Codakia orbicularis)]|nr:hypothetical protein [Candidatus Thiodiazotropha sp. (ex Lucina pensylvanica)]MBT3052734.1 hypothetical protein [Candidatus Thiodiazotropha sp. (ex Codakia orbicularis)]MBT3056954.1 hypothetical protein [Candidatus Thiodiazotropha sp. (ex Codakia orbicularis)]